MEDGERSIKYSRQSSVYVRLPSFCLQLGTEMTAFCNHDKSNPPKRIIMLSLPSNKFRLHRQWLFPREQSAGAVNMALPFPVVYD